MITFPFVLNLLRSVNTLNSELKFKTILINKLKLLPTPYHEATLTFLTFASKHYWTPLLRRFLCVSYTQLYVAYSKLSKRKANHTLCLESLRPPWFWTFSKPLIFGLVRDAHDQYTNPLARPLMIASASCENIVWISFKRMYGK